jgi:hypothetical protein
MNTVNNSCGAVAVFFDPEDNPGLFENDSNFVLKKFDLYGKKCALISEGSTVTLLSDPGKTGEEELLTVSVPEGLTDKINSFVLKWYNNSVSLHADICLTGKEIRQNA